MSWEKRNKRSYYYHVQRSADGRIKKTYHGGGFAGVLAYNADQKKQRKRNRKIARHRSLIAYVRRVTEPVTELCDLCDLATEAALVAAGYHHHRGEWRKRHGRLRSASTRSEH